MCHRNWLSPCHGHIIAIQSMQWLPGCCRAAADALRGEQEPRQAGSSRRVSLTLHCTISGGRQAGRQRLGFSRFDLEEGLFMCRYTEIDTIVNNTRLPLLEWWETRPGQYPSSSIGSIGDDVNGRDSLYPTRCYQRDIIRLFCGLRRCIDRNGVIHRRWIKTKLFL